MFLTEWQIANAIIDGESAKLKDADFSKTNWFEVLQLIQGLLGEEIEEVEEASDQEREVIIQKQSYDRVRVRAAKFKIELPELVE